MRVFAQPPIASWTVDRPMAPDVAAERAQLASIVNQHAQALGTGCLETTAPLLASGHQAWLWHPGILAKYAAMTHAADRLRAGSLNLIVDQDIHDVVTIPLPVQQGDQLQLFVLQLGQTRSDVPTGCQPPLPAAQVQDALADARAQVQLQGWPGFWDLLHDAFDQLPPCSSLAQQMAVVLTRLYEPYVGRLPVVMVTDLARLPAFQAILCDMLHDAQGCIRAYNRAAAAVPHARLTQLTIERERIELPLWLLQDNQPRERVYADIAGSDPLLIRESGEVVEVAKVTLAPRALLLTALMRSWYCDLFIHGRGGVVYDQATEAWWQAWRNEPLAPMAMVSADLNLPMGVPLAEANELHKAQWRVHHLPHNVDRALQLDNDLTRRKRQLLTHMDDDRDKRRRYQAFRELHAINEQLVREHPQLIEQAREQLERTQVGVENAARAARRDWCFALYPPAMLEALAQAWD